MFESIVLKRSIDGPPITVGEIAEALLFYQSIHIVMDTSTLLGLIRSIGFHNVIKLLAYPDVRTTYVEEFIGVYSDTTNGWTEYALTSAYVCGGKNCGELKSWKKRLEYMIARQGHSKTEVDNFIERFRRHVTIKKLNSDHFIKGGIISAANEDLNDGEYVSSATRIIIGSLPFNENVVDNFYYKVLPSQGKFRVSTNIDFVNINNLQKILHPDAGEYTPADIAAGILSASYGLILAAHYGGDFYTSAIESEIIQQKNKHILTRANANRTELIDFYEIALKGCPNISAVINEGDRSFEEFLELLSRANKFKKWLKGKSPDKKLLSDYLDDVTTTGWLGSGSGKILRYFASTGIGFAEPITGVLVSAFDAFFLDKLSAGWKPNQFISGKIKSFVDVHDDF
ncbi:hypothetical protein OH773_22080 (plasmid) [Buttiauxella sp. WJP83]|uniref:hypothetical protein n=1 Tax=Buttiauxella sp. WJP83 TaxID=2986951 RepID=UPI0022DE110D|nr:hypothetical protein [Buttiauxella sp. WJP83]WBM72934.1 hypothetical protein OH773_22080 [Buttiauxella sp. WJP83]